ncbi:helix-turn-helix transcriptional regulator [Lactococcus lactis]
MIGKKLKEYRLSLKFTGDTLANLAGIKRSYLSQIENEKKYHL